VTYTKIAAESEDSQFATLNDEEFNELLENVESQSISIMDEV
jgi:hypothetical protein